VILVGAAIGEAGALALDADRAAALSRAA